MNRSGFSLLELMLAMVLSAGIIAATSVYLTPSLGAMTAIQSNNSLRLGASTIVDTLARDTSNAGAVYAGGGSLCYAFCVVSADMATRTYYYWGAGADTGTLFRKQESVNGNAISCAGGKAVTPGVDPNSTVITVRKNLLSVTFGTKGSYKTVTGKTDNNSYLLASSFFPPVMERDIIFNDGFECNTLADAWTIAQGSRVAWSVLPSPQHTGLFQIPSSSVGTTTDSATATLALDLSKTTTPQLTFVYNNAGTIGANDTFKVDLWDGASWTTVFTEARHIAIPSPYPVQVDLSPFTRNSSNQLRFTATLTNPGASWNMDQVKVFTP